MEIRIGNDFNVKWAIFRVSGQQKLPENLSVAKNVKLILFKQYDALCRFEVTAKIKENVISFQVPASKQQLGKYIVVLEYELEDTSQSDGLRRITLDRDAFEIVDRSCKVNVFSAEDMSVDTIELSSEFSGGINGVNGLSAYELAAKHGFAGTEEEYLQSIKGELGDKGEKGADADIEGANAAIKLANAAATNAENKITELNTKLGDLSNLSAILDNINGEVV